MTRARTWLSELRRHLRMRERSITAFRKHRSLISRPAIIRRYCESHEIIKIQVGCGENLLPGWLNTDLSADEHIVYLDATKPLPWPSNSVDYIFSEHMFEHIAYHEGQLFLQETHRILKPGGRLRISTPNLAFLIRVANEAESDLVKRYIRFAVDRYVSEPKIYAPGVVINNFFYSWGHRFIYDSDTLMRSLQDAGYAEVLPCEPSQSSDPNLRGLEAHSRILGEEFNDFESLVMEAPKPIRRSGR